MILLQTNVDFFVPPDPRQGIIFGGIFLGLILVAVIGSKLSGPGTSGGSGGNASFLLRLSFRRKARRAGLSRQQARLLDRMAQKHNAADRNRLLTSTRSLDRLLTRSLATAETESTSDYVREQMKHDLLQIRSRLGRMDGNGSPVKSSRKLRQGTEIIIRTSDKTQYDSRVVASTEQLLGIEAPGPGPNEHYGWSKGMPLVILFDVGGDGLYGFKTKVAGYRTRRGTPALYVDHSDTISSAQKRKSPRKDFGNPAYFFPVLVVTEGRGRNRKKRAVVDSAKRQLGTIQDISAGGCGLRARTSMKPGTLIKITFEVRQGTNVTVFGKLLSVEPGYRGSLLHVKFTKVSRVHMNEIMAYVYGYTGERQERAYG